MAPGTISVAILLALAPLVQGQDGKIATAPRSSDSQRSKLIASIEDLELGMPRDLVLASLLGQYRLEEEVKGSDAWDVFSGDAHAGELLFRDGTLAAAGIMLNSPSHCDSDTIDRLFEAIYDNSGRSSIEEGSAGTLTRTRSAAVLVESQELTIGRLQSRTLKFAIGQKKLYILSVTTQPEGSRDVTLMEGIVKKWQGKVKQKPQPK
jgi:hypothetical protein